MSIIRPLGDLNLVSANKWDQAVVSKSPHLSAYKKSDSIRWGNFLKKVDGAHSVEAVNGFIRSFNSTTFKDPLDVMVSSQMVNVANDASLRHTNTFREALIPFAGSTLTANGEGGILCGFHSSQKKGNFSADKYIVPRLRELYNEPSSSLESGSPGLILTEDRSECVDNVLLFEQNRLSYKAISSTCSNRVRIEYTASRLIFTDLGNDLKEIIKGVRRYFKNESIPENECLHLNKLSRDRKHSALSRECVRIKELYPSTVLSYTELAELTRKAKAKANPGRKAAFEISGSLNNTDTDK